MNYTNNNKLRRVGSKSGMVLLVTLILLVVLSTLGYTLTSRIASQRHRERYMLDYCNARYACDSAVKYALATLEDINSPALVIRAKEPDFSDLFALTEEQYKDFLLQWAEQLAQTESETIEPFGDINDINDINNVTAPNDINDARLDYNEPFEPNGLADFNDPNNWVVRGPYGPPWPLVAEPAEFEIGTAKVKIEIEDENAKYPLGWAVLQDEKVKRQAWAGFETFCEWMEIEDEQIDEFESQLEEISEIRQFNVEFKPITKQTAIKGNRKRRGRSKRRQRTRYKKTTIPVGKQIDEQTENFARLFHSSLIDTETLARPIVVSKNRKESALKYMGTWGGMKVNINTAPRQVLEAAFTFGGDEVRIAEEIILTRRLKPYKDIEELRKSLFRYSDSIEKCKKYITTTSSFFTIKITVVSGVARASAIIAVMKDNKNKLKSVAMISG